MADDTTNVNSIAIGNIKQTLFDSQQAVITVGTQNQRFPFDSFADIFELYQGRKDTAKA